MATVRQKRALREGLRIGKAVVSNLDNLDVRFQGAVTVERTETHLLLSVAGALSPEAVACRHRLELSYPGKGRLPRLAGSEGLPTAAAERLHVLYLHRSLKPLAEADLSDGSDPRQLNLFNNECEGMCGV